ncbi:MAG TPA: CDP-alcohol phosphatidyltransferase family protein [Candidatus Omnitrophota bacterium]|nr:CDP-alcohol phosphatidyltransferase family protein [Candidatus Omnitrophota bacterium]
MNWANRLTVLRVILVPVFVMAVLYHRLDAALVVFAVASVTDALDGYLARTLNQKTKFGATIDPIADKLLIMSAFVSLSLVSGLPEYSRMPVYVPVAVISRDVIILLGAGVIYFHNGGIEIRPTSISKITTFFQMLTVISVLLKFVYSAWIWNIAVILTIVSGLDYIKRGADEINGKQ